MLYYYNIPFAFGKLKKMIRVHRYISIVTYGHDDLKGTYPIYGVGVRSGNLVRRIVLYF